MEKKNFPIEFPKPFDFFLYRFLLNLFPIMPNILRTTIRMKDKCCSIKRRIIRFTVVFIESLPILYNSNSKFFIRLRILILSYDINKTLFRTNLTYKGLFKIFNKNIHNKKHPIDYYLIVLNYQNNFIE
jgi:hypothetical protein